jgi:hypothetical protein
MVAFQCTDEGSSLPSPLTSFGVRDTDHPASTLFEQRPLIFTAHAAETAHLRERVCAFVLRAGGVPVNPWMMGGYFLYGLVEKDDVRRANNNLLMRSDELWVFGPVSDGVEVEVEWARRHDVPVRWFDLDHYGEAIIEHGDSTG